MRKCDLCGLLSPERCLPRATPADGQQVVDEELYSHPDNVTGAESSYDAQEARNLARDPAFSSVVASQRARLRAEVEAYHSAWPGRGAVAQRIRSVACKGGYKQAC